MFQTPDPDITSLGGDQLLWQHLTEASSFPLSWFDMLETILPAT